MAPLRSNETAVYGLRALLAGMDLLTNEEVDELAFALWTRCSSTTVERLLRRALDLEEQKNPA